MKIVSYDLVSQSVKQQFCPRQVFAAYPVLTNKEFLDTYCNKFPCKGDIKTNCHHCWEMLETHVPGKPFVQNTGARLIQQPKCPGEFFAHLGDFCDVVGRPVVGQFKIFHNNFWVLNRDNKICGACMIPCRISGCPTQVDNICWAKFFKELKAHQK